MVCNSALPPASAPLHIVDGEKLRAMLLINPTKSTLLLILNRGEVGPKKPRQTSCIWFNRQLILLQSSPIKLSSQSLSPKPSEPNSIKTLDRKSTRLNSSHQIIS